MNIAHKITYGLKAILMILFLSIGTITMFPQQAKAHSCCACASRTCSCVAAAHLATQLHITSQFQSHQSWMINTFWYDNVLPAMMMMTTQLSAVAMQQVQIVGSFLDAKMQLETQQLLQRLHAQAHKDYRPSEEICSIGTTVRSLASSERKSQTNSVVLGRRLIDRQMRNEDTLAGAGDSTDVATRIQRFASIYCNPKDNAGQLEDFCGTTSPDRQNKDIDFTRTLDVPMTLDIDFAKSPGSPTEDEQDILELANNLYSPNVLSNSFVFEKRNRDLVKNEEFLKWRSVRKKKKEKGEA